jgi:membrane protease YdiL (CAAX protease family)
MISILNELIQYLINPVLEKDVNNSFLYRFKVLIYLLLISFIFSFFISTITRMLTLVGVLNDVSHITDSLFDDSNGFKIIFSAAILAPLIEELIFRGPLVYFNQPRVFKIVFYTIGVIFAYVHIFNFDITSNVLLFSPLLVAPQFFIGLIFGFIRVRFGLIWSIFLHSIYNGILVSLFLLASHGNP